MQQLAQMNQHMNPMGPPMPPGFFQLPGMPRPPMAMPMLPPYDGGASAAAAAAAAAAVAAASAPPSQPPPAPPPNNNNVVKAPPKPPGRKKRVEADIKPQRPKDVTNLAAPPAAAAPLANPPPALIQPPRQRPPRKEIDWPPNQYRYAVVDRNGKTQQGITKTVTFRDAKALFRTLSSQGVELVRCRCCVNLEEGRMIRCDECETWQHAECMMLGDGNDSEPDYLCELCNPRTLDEDILLPGLDRSKRKPEDIIPYKVLNCNGRRLVLGSCVYNHSPNGEKTVCRILALQQMPNGERTVTMEPYLRPEETEHQPGRRFYPREVFASGEIFSLPPDTVTGKRCCVMDVASWRVGRPLEYDYDDIFVCEFAYQRSTQAFIPSKEERWGAVQESYLFERFDAPLQSRRKFTKEVSDTALPDEIVQLGPRTASLLRDGRNPDHTVALPPSTALAELWACLALGCGRKFSAFTELTRHINENHAERGDKVLLMSRSQLPLEVAKTQEYSGPDLEDIFEMQSAAQRRTRRRTATVEEMRKPPSTLPTTSGQVVSETKYKSASPADSECEDPSFAGDSTGIPRSLRRRRMADKLVTGTLADHFSMPPIGPVLAEVTDVMPNSRGFSVRIFRNNKLFQGICVEQEPSMLATVPRSRFSRLVTGPGLQEHVVDKDKRTLTCPEPGCEERFADPTEYFNHLGVHNIWAPAQGKAAEVESIDASTVVTCPYSGCRDQFVDPCTLCSHILTIHTASAKLEEPEPELQRNTVQQPSPPKPAQSTQQDAKTEQDGGEQQAKRVKVEAADVGAFAAGVLVVEPQKAALANGHSILVD